MDIPEGTTHYVVITHHPSVRKAYGLETHAWNEHHFYPSQHEAYHGMGEILRERRNGPNGLYLRALPYNKRPRVTGNVYPIEQFERNEAIRVAGYEAKVRRNSAASKRYMARANSRRRQGGRGRWL